MRLLRNVALLVPAVRRLWDSRNCLLTERDALLTERDALLTEHNMEGRLKNDDEWFELQFRPEEALKKYGVMLPTLPSDEVQISFTGLCGRANLQQAFNFYRYICSVCQINDIREPRILDFGGGWGRVSRFFLRDTLPECIFISEVREYAIQCIRATGNRCQVIHNQPRPPILELTGLFDLVYAYSVFSHLSGEYVHAWINYLLGVLRPGGYLVFTTNGQQFIDNLEHLPLETNDPNLQELFRRLREDLPLPEEIRRRHLKGEFQFYPLGVGAELTSDFSGETLIPRSYIEKNFISFFVDFNENVPNVDQSVVVFQKPA